MKLGALTRLFQDAPRIRGGNMKAYTAYKLPSGEHLVDNLLFYNSQISLVPIHRPRRGGRPVCPGRTPNQELYIGEHATIRAFSECATITLLRI